MVVKVQLLTQTLHASATNALTGSAAMCRTDSCNKLMQQGRQGCQRHASPPMPVLAQALHAASAAAPGGLTYAHGKHAAVVAALLARAFPRACS
jgi:hypothetical protein